MKTFINLTGALLLGVGLSLCLVNWTTPAYLVLPPDPVLGLPLRWLFWILAGMALTVSVLVLFNDRASWPLFLLAWLGLNLMVYQCGLYSEHCHGLTGYLGGFLRTFGITPKTADALTKVLTGYLLLAGCGALIWQRRSRKLDANFLKMFCPACGGHIKFGLTNLGQSIPCPHCRASVVLRHPGENLRMSCYFCKGHIEFPPHALGQKIACPHCRMEIRLQTADATA